MHTRSILPTDADYPPRILAAHESPPRLRVRGALPQIPGVAVVGTRDASIDGKRFASELAAALASAGFAVWSGGASGIDRAAHDGALSADGITVLVAGGGLDHPYPEGAEELYARVVNAGAVVGIVDDADSPKPWIFHARNEVLAAATIATVVIEAPLRSGTRNTTSHARRMGRPVYWFGQAPWSPFACALREEVRLGAQLVLSIDDLLAALVSNHPPPDVVAPVVNKKKRGGHRPPKAPKVDLPEPERQVLARLAIAPLHTDQLCELLGWPAAETHRVTLSLLLLGEIQTVDGGRYALSKSP